jgi:hypothetical protein
LGGFVGGFVANNFKSMPMNVIGINLEMGLGSSIETFNSFSNAITSTIASGVTGGFLDYGGHLMFFNNL